MKNLPPFVVLWTTVLLWACASTSSTVYNKDGLKRIETWEVVFAYESGEIEEPMSNQGESTARVTKTGQPSSDLQLRDDIFFNLKDKHNVSLSTESKRDDGQIRLHPVHFVGGGFKSVDVTFYDFNNQLLARVRIKNGDRNATFKDDDDFAEYAANAIAEILK